MVKGFGMKKFLLLAALFAAFFFACTSDYDTFGSSDYNDLNTLTFTEQDGRTTYSRSANSISITLQEVPDSLDTWDSVTVSEVDISNFSTLHLVTSKFESFPTDSATRDSLSAEVSYSEEKLKVGSRIRLPSSHLVYVVVVSESGLPDLWQITFEVPGVEATTSSESEESSSSEDEEAASSSSEAALSSETGLTFEFENQLSIDTTGDTLLATLNITSRSSAALASWAVSSGASVSPSPDSVTSWAESQEFVVTAEDGETTQTWTLLINLADLTDVLAASAEGELVEAAISYTDKTITFYFREGTDVSSVEVEIEIQDGAISTLESPVDLSEDVTFTVSTEDDTAAWTIKVEFVIEPSITALVLDGSYGAIDSDALTIKFDSLTFMLDLTALEVEALETPAGITCDIEEGSTYDFSYGKTVTCANSIGESVSYVVKAGYQIPGSDFNDWEEDSEKSYLVQPDTIWDNANLKYLVKIKMTYPYPDEDEVTSATGAKMVTGSNLGVISSGSLYTADFNPNGVSALSMASTSTWPDGNELIDFGKPFKARPEYVEFRFQYDNGGEGDSCDLYVLLENRTGDKNIDRTSSDVNTLVASAWFRSTSSTQASRTLPDLESIEVDDEGFSVVRLKFNYGAPLSGSPIEASTLLNDGVQSTNSNAIDNTVVEGTGEEAVTHVRVVMASSSDGNEFVGTEDATLIVDYVKLIY